MALLGSLGLLEQGGASRHVCIQGKLENSRRNYTAAFEAIRCACLVCVCCGGGERVHTAINWAGRIRVAPTRLIGP